jgi:DNA (cytosine-5)-methyltransferase 1
MAGGIIRYLSVCSGIEAATVAWHPLGWEAAAFSEIEAFPRAVLKHHYPEVPLHGDFTTIGADEYGPIDLLVGGTPCQSFSVAGLRGGMDDERGQLALQFLKLLDRTRARWVVWENVPGVLSSNGGRDFGSFLGGLVELGYGFAYRVLDAQHFGVPQRRRRVFVVGHLGDWRRAAAVLFERHSLSGHPAPSRRGSEGVAGALAAGAHPGGFNGQDAYTNQLVACRVSGNAGAWDTGGRTDALTSANDGAAQHLIVAIQDGSGRDKRQNGKGWSDDGSAYTLDAAATQAVAQGAAVRKMTPNEWERLQGLPDDYTLVPYRGKPAADGPRYKALGNSMAVPVMAFIGQRIAIVDGRRMAETTKIGSVRSTTSDGAKQSPDSPIASMRAA